VGESSAEVDNGALERDLLERINALASVRTAMAVL
jgi:hypothetical protein